MTRSISSTLMDRWRTETPVHHPFSQGVKTKPGPIATFAGIGSKKFGLVLHHLQDVLRLDVFVDVED